MARVVRVYGRADSFDIELTKNGDKWEVDVPPDMTDGVYAVQLTAVNDVGETAYWVGELFMVGGVCCLRLEPPKFWTKIRTKEHVVTFHKGARTEVRLSDEFVTEFSPSYTVYLRKSNRPRYKVSVEKRLHLGGPCPSYDVQLQTRATDVKTRRLQDVEYIKTLTLTWRKECQHAQR